MIPLSILIPSVPSRFDKALALFRSVEIQTEGMDVEILMMTDNKKRTIGEKRDDLKDLSKGKYFMIVDDDDNIFHLNEIYKAACETDVDVISFNSCCKNDDGSSYVVTMQLGNPIEHNTENGRYLDCKRPPFQMCAWHYRFKEYKYSYLNYAEDWSWVSQALEHATTEHHINRICHLYNFNSSTSEASL